eukprot:15460965-Alexandrium_andersonii.AAC.1
MPRACRSPTRLALPCFPGQIRESAGTASTCRFSVPRFTNQVERLRPAVLSTSGPQVGWNSCAGPFFPCRAPDS